MRLSELFYFFPPDSFPVENSRTSKWIVLIQHEPGRKSIVFCKESKHFKEMEWLCRYIKIAEEFVSD